MDDERKQSKTAYSSVQPVAKGRAVTDDDVTDKIVKGKTVEKKRSLGQKIADAFISTDSQSIKDYVLFDLLIPGLKTAVEDIVHMILFDGKGAARADRKSSSGIRRVRYSQVFDEKRALDTIVSPRARVGNTDIIFETEDDAIAIRRAVAERIEETGFCTVKYYLSEAGMQSNFTHTKWGWSDVNEVKAAKIVQVRAGWILKMPRIEEID